MTFAHRTFARHNLRATVLAAILVPANDVLGADATMWGCAPPGQRRSVIYLADHGSNSYVKIGGQRAPAALVVEDGERTWSWGSNRVTLSADGVAEYYENNAAQPKARFRCKLMGAR